MIARYKLILFSIAGILIVAHAGVGLYIFAYRNRVMPGVSVGTLALGGMTRADALDAVSAKAEDLRDSFITLTTNGKTTRVSLGIFFDDHFPNTAVERAWELGRTGPWLHRWWDYIGALVHDTMLDAPVRLDEENIANTLDEVADAFNEPRRDIRLLIENGRAQLLKDVKSGLTIHRDDVRAALIARAQALDISPIEVMMYEETPYADEGLAEQALRAAERMVSAPIILSYEDYVFTLSRSMLGSWLQSGYEGARLVPILDEQQVSEYITTIARTLNIEPVKAVIETQEGRVVRFVPPKPGRALEEEKVIALITDTLMKRRDNQVSGATAITLPMRTARPSLGDTGNLSGISELIGKATTPFTGSPRNRISNIKNGIKFLSGFIIEAGQEFSTLATLGTIDNTTGYLPELVIKGDRTIPEYGGGLCQVSTTLFRAVLNAGLPVTARRNHSYRVSYYEKDGTGKYIGPGLDATIYEPDVDFRFLNDTGAAVMIFGYVEGDKATFELYGTSDGRTATIIGPKLLTETAPGEPVYTETDTLAKGVKKQIETPHPGGSATATYIITYPDGHSVEKKFDSWYRRWPARYLIGTKE
jgi:vancomycin resistance protein YoaR